MIYLFYKKVHMQNKEKDCFIYFRKFVLKFKIYKKDSIYFLIFISEQQHIKYLIM